MFDKVMLYRNKKVGHCFHTLSVTGAPCRLSDSQINIGLVLCRFLIIIYEISVQEMFMG